MADEQTPKAAAKGFAGLADLASNVSSIPPTARPPDPAAARPSPPPPAPPAAEVHSSRLPVQPDASDGLKWLVGIAIGLGALFIFSQSDRKSESTPGATPVVHDTSAQPPTLPMSLGLPNSGKPEAMPTEPSQNEERPPVGTDVVFNAGQIRYCAAEKIRLAAQEVEARAEISSDVSRFNAKVADFNARCGSFRYRRGEFERVTQEVESRTGDIERDARIAWYAGMAAERPMSKQTSSAKPHRNSSAVLTGH